MLPQYQSCKESSRCSINTYSCLMDWLSHDMVQRKRIIGAFGALLSPSCTVPESSKKHLLFWNRTPRSRRACHCMDNQTPFPVVGILAHFPHVGQEWHLKAGEESYCTTKHAAFTHCQGQHSLKTLVSLWLQAPITDPSELRNRRRGSVKQMDKL